MDKLDENKIEKVNGGKILGGENLAYGMLDNKNENMLSGFNSSNEYGEVDTQIQHMNSQIVSVAR